MKNLSLFVIIVVLPLQLLAHDTPIAQDRHRLSLLPEGVANSLLLQWRSTPRAQRRAMSFNLQTIEIPLNELREKLQTYPSSFLQREITNTLITRRNGQAYFNWPIHPDDQSLFNELRFYLSEHNIGFRLREDLKGFRTAGDSFVVYNPANQSVFSLRVSSSTNENVVNAQYVSRSRAASDILKRVMDNYHLDYVVPKLASYGATLSEIDQGFLVEGLSHVSSNNIALVPGSVFRNNHQAHRVIESYPHSLTAFPAHVGRSLGELFTHTGIIFDEVLAENFSMILDEQARPTAKILIKNLGSAKLFLPFAQRAYTPAEIAKWGEDHLLDNIDAYMASDDAFRIAGRRSESATRGLVGEISHLTGVDELSLVVNSYTTHSTGVRISDATEADFNRFIRNAACFAGTISDARSCHRIFPNINNKRITSSTSANRNICVDLMASLKRRN